MAEKRAVMIKKSDLAGIKTHKSFSDMLKRTVRQLEAQHEDVLTKEKRKQASDNRRSG